MADQTNDVDWLQQRHQWPGLQGVVMVESTREIADKIERETRFVKRKIEELENELRQFENKMGMFNFKSASGEAMRKELEKQADRTRRDVERLREQHKQLVKELRQA